MAEEMDIGQAAKTETATEKQSDKATALDKLFAESFNMTPLATHTEFYNQVHAFKEKAKALLA